MTCHWIKMSLWEKTDALLRLWQRYPYWHNLSFLSLFISSFCLCKYVNICTDAISLFLICSASHTHSLYVSPLASSLSPPLHFAYKPMANLLVLSLIAIKSSDKHHCFTQRAKHNTVVIQQIPNQSNRRSMVQWYCPL